jgi:hypothetical protein
MLYDYQRKEFVQAGRVLFVIIAGGGLELETGPKANFREGSARERMSFPKTH